MTGTTHADIAIVGDGVAGCAAALSLQHCGWSVVVIAPAGRERPAIGESLSPSAGAILDELGVAALFAAGPQRPSNATYAAWDAPLLVESNTTLQVGSAGHVLDRLGFGQMLLGAATRAPTEMIDGVVRHTARKGGEWSLRIDGGGEVTARLVIDCSGRAAVFARHLARRRRTDQLIAASCILDQRADDVEPSAATLIEAVDDGWWYATLVPGRRLSLMFFTDPDLLPRGLSHDARSWRHIVDATCFLRRWLDSADFTVASAPRLSSAATTWLEVASGAGWAAAGDAAAAFDPLSSHGLTTALWSGRRAALAAAASLGGQPEPLRSYAQVFAQATHDFLQQRRAIYTRVERFRDRPFWRRRTSSMSHSAAASSARSRHRLGPARDPLDCPPDKLDASAAYSG